MNLLLNTVSDFLSLASTTGVGRWMMTILMMICSSEGSERGGTEGNWTSTCVFAVRRHVFLCEFFIFIFIFKVQLNGNSVFEQHRL